MLPDRKVEFSSEGINGCHSRNARLFQWNKLSVAVKRVYVNKTKSDTYVFKNPRAYAGFLMVVRWNLWLVYKFSRLSIAAPRISCVLPHWVIVMQRNSLSVDVYIYFFTMSILEIDGCMSTISENLNFLP